MFKDEYKKANDNLTPSADVTAKVAAAMSAAKSEAAAPPPKQVIKLPLRSIIATAACIAFVLGSVFVWQNIPEIKKTDKTASSKVNTVDTADGQNIVSGVESVDENAISPDLELPSDTVPKPQDDPSQNKDTTSTESKPFPKPGKLPTHTYDDIFDTVDEVYENSGAKDYNIEYFVDDSIGTNSDTFEGSVAPSTPLSPSKPNAVNGESDGNKGNGASNNNSSSPSKPPASTPDTNTNSNTADNAEQGYSETTNQVEGVDEADIVKTDGKYIYFLNIQTGKLIIYRANGDKTKKVSTTKIAGQYDGHEMFINGDVLAVMYDDSRSSYTSDRYYKTPETRLDFYDISDPKSISLTNETGQCGEYVSSRMMDGKIYLVTDHGCRKPTTENRSTYLPYAIVEGEKAYFKASSIWLDERSDKPRYTVVSSYSTKTGKPISNKGVFGGSGEVYMNEKYLVTATYNSYAPDRFGDMVTDQTSLLLFLIDNGRVTYITNGSVKGEMLNQFCMDIHNDHLRIVTTVHNYDKDNEPTNSLYVLDNKLKTVGKITGLAEDEQIYSARFTGDIGYFVTFRETDPLFAVDLKNPEKPKILSALKIDGFSSYLHPYGDGKLLGLGYNAIDGIQTSLKLTMFDTSDLTDVSEIVTTSITKYTSYSDGTSDHKAVFVDVEKNLIGFNVFDVGNYEYADSYNIYKYKKSGFKLVKKVELDDPYRVRGLYVGKYFYIISSNDLFVLDMDTWEIVLKK